jgi:hypothetical protein
MALPFAPILASPYQKVLALPQHRPTLHRRLFLPPPQKHARLCRSHLPSLFRGCGQ